MRHVSKLIAFALVLAAPAFCAEKKEAPATNKLQYMYQFFYLPFSVDFRQGRNNTEAFPHVVDKSGAARLIDAKTLDTFSKEWEALRKPWAKKSLLLTTQVQENQSVRIAPKLTSHVISMNRGAFDSLTLTEKMQINEAIKDKASDVVASFRQIRFVRSFLGPEDEGKFNLIIISPSWDLSSREYRLLFESYVKRFPHPAFALHSVVVNDPKEEFFDSRINKELFPHPAKYSTENTPRFLAFETLNGNPTLYEEGDALKQAYERFFRDKRGFMDDSMALTKGLK